MSALAEAPSGAVDLLSFGSAEERRLWAYRAARKHMRGLGKNEQRLIMLAAAEAAKFVREGKPETETVRRAAVEEAFAIMRDDGNDTVESIRAHAMAIFEFILRGKVAEAAS